MTKKLVRDNIPEIIKKETGKSPPIYTADSKEFEIELTKKLIEEVEEFLEGFKLEELADVFEVIYKICKLKNIDLAEVEGYRKKKKKERGGFDRKIIWEG